MSGAVQILEIGPHPVTHCEFSADRAHILVRAGNEISLWDTGAGRRIAALGSADEIVRTGALSPRGDRIVTLTQDSFFHVWDGRSGAELASYEIKDGSGNACAFVPAGPRVLIGGLGFLKDFDLETGEGHAQFDLPEDFWVTKCSCTSDGAGVIAADDLRGELACWKSSGGDIVAALHPDNAYLEQIAEVNDGLVPAQEGWGFTPDGRFAVARFFGGHKIFDAVNGAELAKLTRMSEDSWEWHPRRNNPSHITADALSPAGNRLAVAYEDGALILWNLSGAELWRRRLNPRQSYASHMAFSADGSRLFTAALTCELALWDAASGKQLVDLLDPEDGCPSYSSCCALSADGAQAACGLGHGRVILWDLGDR